MYEPWDHAHQLGVLITHHPLAGNLRGRYLHRRRLIILRPGMTSVEERSVLAHELVHAEFGDEDTPDLARWRRYEWRADRIAARRLISMESFLRACALHSHARLIAMELGVSPWVVRAFSKDLEARSPGLSRSGHGMDAAGF